MKLTRSVWLIPLLLVGVTVSMHGQQRPFGLPVPPLGAGPFVFETAEQSKIRVAVLTRGLAHPWAIAFMPDGSMLVTERPGRLRVIRDGMLDPHPIAGVPQVRTDGNGGLMDVALHPRFAENHLVYLTYTKPVGNGRGAPALARGRLDGAALVDVRDLVVTEAFEGNSGLNGRVVFGRDGLVYMSTGGNTGKVVTGSGEPARQDPPAERRRLGPARQPLREPRRLSAGDLHAGAPQHARPHRASGDWGHLEPRERSQRRRRDQHHRARAELRVADRELRARLSGPARLRTSDAEGMESPLVVWVPSIAVAGMAVYTGDRFPAWKGNVFVGACGTGEIPGTGHLQRIVFNAKTEEMRREAMLRELRQRIREVRQGPDGLLYLLTDDDDGALLRIEPL